ncbi:MAG: acyl-CoA dehydrogenase [Spirochaetota bacterium]
MAEKFFSERNLRFTLYDVHDVASLAGSAYYADHGRETFDILLDTARKIATEHLYPFYTEMDRNPPRFENGGIRVHPSVRDYLRIAGEGGWINAVFPYEMGGQQIPVSIFFACQFMMAAANYSLSVYPELASGAARLIYSFGSEELQKTYAEKMVAGTWQGTMALTEPEAGSSLSDVTTSAEPTAHGYYLIRGQKTFISAGDHDCADNIVHLMLARVKGAPAGVKGLSLFVVPKKRVAADGAMEFNDVNCTGCYHKMGYRGAPIAQLSMGEENDCRGYLVGEEGRGLACMFQMMNEARIGVGMGATAIATAAYYASLEYARVRLQGRRITEKDATRPQIPIIEHADIKRMLLKQRAITEGSLSLMIYAGKLLDLHLSGEGEERERNELLLDFLTPIVKSYPSEMGIVSTSQAIQCLGGYGYSDEFPVEQYMRDARIHPIHEGTTGIQGMDLLGRKVTMKNGKAFGLYLEEIAKTTKEAKSLPGLAGHAARLEEAVEIQKKVTGSLVEHAMKGAIERFLADATLYLEMAGVICIAWQWLMQGVVALRALDAGASGDGRTFLEGKLCTMRYFFEYELPAVDGLSRRLMSTDAPTVEMKAEHFDD